MADQAASSVAVKGAREGSFGYPMADAIIKQIELRGNVFAKNTKSPQEQLYIHGNAPWIMLRSGVDTPVPGTEDVSSSDAKNYILVGGTAVISDDRIQFREGFVGRPNPVYRLSSVMGYRPIPGITSINVKSKDTWGAIMEAEISLQVWSKEDMTIIDKLFFKPGMTALLEWGHSMWLDNEGKIQTTSIDTILSNDEFFTSQAISELDKKIQARRDQFCGNYEACFGFITNFSYSFNDKGGYDCTIKMLSKSSVLEGLKIHEAKDTDKVSQEASKNTTSEYHKLFQNIITDGVVYNERTGREVDCDAQELSKLYEGTNVDHWRSAAFRGKDIFKDIKMVMYLRCVRTKDKNWFRNIFVSDDYTNVVYIHLRDLLKIIELSNNIKDPNSDGIGLVKFDLNSQNEYVTFDQHFSLNPFIANKPKVPTVFTDAYISIPTGGNSKTFEEYTKACSLVKQPSNREPNEDVDLEELKGSNKILNIVVGVNHFLGIIDTLIESEHEEYSIFTALNTLLKDIQKAFGNINDFGLHYNEISGVFSIVDRNCSKLWEDSSDGPGKICVSGLNTTVQKLTVNSAISPSIANEMSIAATAPASGSQESKEGRTESSPSLVNWNEGCKNRHWMSKDEAKAVTNQKEEEKIDELGIYYNKKDYENFKEKIKGLYNGFNKFDETGDDVGGFAENGYQSIQLDGENIFKRIINKEAATGITAGSLCMGVIPVKVELDMLGISRFVVGTSFRITPGILLPKYDNWGYIVTGIENKVDANGWKSHIRTQYFPVLKTKKISSGQYLDSHENMYEPQSNDYTAADGYAEEKEPDSIGEVTKQKPLICLTPAHGTAGTKRKEHAWSQKLITSYIVPLLKGYNVKVCDKNQRGKSTSGVYSLREARNLVSQYGSDKVISVVPHWNGGHGTYWCAYTACGNTAPEGSDKLLQIFCQVAKNKLQSIPGLGVTFPEKSSDLQKAAGRPDANDPAVQIGCTRILTENLFADNEAQGRWIQSPQGMQILGQLHADAIKQYISQIK